MKNIFILMFLAINTVLLSQDIENSTSRNAPGTFTTRFQNTNASGSVKIMLSRGNDSLEMLLKGENNICFGYKNAAALTTGHDNLFLGLGSGKYHTTESYIGIIGNRDYGSKSNEINNAPFYFYFPTNSSVNNQININAKTYLKHSTHLSDTLWFPDGSYQLIAFDKDTLGFYETLDHLIGHYYNVTKINDTLGNYLLKNNDTATNLTISDSVLNFDIGSYWTALKIPEYRSIALGSWSTEPNFGTGIENILIGNNVGTAITTGYRNICIGTNAGRYLTTGNNNTFIGRGSGITTTTGGGNTFLGEGSGQMNAGDYNTFIGSAAGLQQTGSNNTFTGQNAGGWQFSKTGSDNAVYGNATIYNVRKLDKNAVFGSLAVYLGDSVDNSCMFGYASGYKSDGIGNVFMGYRSGFNNTGDYNIFIGNDAGYYETGSNLLYIDNSNTANPLIWGDFTNNVVRINDTLKAAAVKASYLGGLSDLTIGSSGDDVTINNDTLKGTPYWKGEFSTDSILSYKFKIDNYSILDSRYLDILAKAQSITYANFLIKFNASTLTPYQWYLVTNRTAYLAGKGQGAGTSGNILVKAVTSNKIELDCYLIGSNPDYVNRDLWKSSTTANTVLWDGFTWSYNSGSKTQEPGAGANWTKATNEVPFINLVHWNVSDDCIFKRYDGSSEIRFDLTWFLYFYGTTELSGNYTLDFNPIDRYCWGNTSYILRNVAYNSVIDNCNSGEYCVCYDNTLSNFAILRYYAPDENSNFISIYGNTLNTSHLVIDTIQNTNTTKILYLTNNALEHSGIKFRKLLNSNATAQSTCGIFDNFMVASYITSSYSISESRVSNNDFRSASNINFTTNVNPFTCLSNLTGFTNFNITGNSVNLSTNEFTGVYQYPIAGTYVHLPASTTLSNKRVDNNTSTLDTTFVVTGLTTWDIISSVNQKFGQFTLSTTGTKETIDSIKNVSSMRRPFKIYASTGDTIILKDGHNIDLDTSIFITSGFGEYIECQYIGTKVKVIGGKYNFYKLKFPLITNTTPQNGELWYNSSLKSLMCYTDSVKQSLIGTFYTRTSKDSLYNSDTETSIIGTGIGTTYLPKDFWVAGKTIKIEISGFISCSGNPSNTLLVKLGSTTLSSGVGTIPNTDRGGFKIEVEILCVAPGSSGSFRTCVRSIFATGSGIVTSYSREIPSYEDVTYNTTLSNQLLDVRYKWGTAAVGNNIRFTHTRYTILN